MDEAIPMLAEACRGVPRLLNRAAALGARSGGSGRGGTQADVEAVLEALDRLGLACGGIGPTDRSRAVASPSAGGGTGKIAAG